MHVDHAHVVSPFLSNPFTSSTSNQESFVCFVFPTEIPQPPFAWKYYLLSDMSNKRHYRQGVFPFLKLKSVAITCQSMSGQSVCNSRAIHEQSLLAAAHHSKWTAAIRLWITTMEPLQKSGSMFRVNTPKMDCLQGIWRFKYLVQSTSQNLTFKHQEFINDWSKNKIDRDRFMVIARW